MGIRGDSGDADGVTGYEAFLGGVVDGGDTRVRAGPIKEVGYFGGGTGISTVDGAGGDIVSAELCREAIADG